MVCRKFIRQCLGASSAVGVWGGKQARREENEDLPTSYGRFTNLPGSSDARSAW